MALVSCFFIRCKYNYYTTCLKEMVELNEKGKCTSKKKIKKSLME